MRSKEYMITFTMLLLVTYTLSLSLVSQAFPAVQTTQTLSSVGTIQTAPGIGVYSNVQCTTKLTSVSWGTLQPGGIQSIICYIKNEGGSPITLSLQTSNWNPVSATNYLALSWNYDSQPINVGSSIAVTLTLTVAPEVTGITNFGFDLTILGM